MPRRPRNIGASSPSPVSQAGLTLAELLIAIAIGGLLLAGLSGVAGGALRAEVAARERNALETDARLAMQRMVAAVAGTRRLLLPLAENPATGYSESIRDPGVLAVTLDWSIDRDRDGFADADNDKDGRIDEDPSGDFSNDAANGIVGIDDDNDGAVDEGGVDGSGVAADDDEAGGFDEDPENGLDDDADGMVDEDAAKDRNNDGAPGLAGVDDDGDSSIDEGTSSDDDEDGVAAEDWLDPVVFRLSGTDLVERMPNLNPSSGTDYTERVIAANVTRFRVERIAPAAAGLPVLVDITLELTGASGRKIKLVTRVRVGGAP